MMYIIGKRLRLMSFVALVALLAACSDDYEESAQQQARQRLQLASYVMQDKEVPLAKGDQPADSASARPSAVGAPWQSVTRATTWSLPTDYVLYEDLFSYMATKPFTKYPVGVFLTRDAVQPSETDPDVKVLKGQFVYSSDKWYSDFEIKKADDYYLYGYYPALGGVSASITPNGTYENGAVLELNNLPTLTGGDVCVIVGAKEGVKDGEGNVSVTGLHPGWFKYHANVATKPETGVETTDPADNYVFLLFDHIYAALRISLKVDGNYDRLRTIVLKKITVQTSAGDQTTQKRTNARITLQKTNGTTPIVGNIVFEPSEIGTGGDANDPMYSSTTGLELTTEPSIYISHFMPQGVDKFTITSTYDVYDKQDNLIRKNCEATNALSISLFDKQTQANRGSIYSINLTIKPTFLYVLSEPDLDNPSVVL